MGQNGRLKSRFCFIVYYALGSEMFRDGLILCLQFAPPFIFSFIFLILCFWTSTTKFKIYQPFA